MYRRYYSAQGKGPCQRQGIRGQGPSPFSAKGSSRLTARSNRFIPGRMHKMKRKITLALIIATLQVFPLLAAGKVYWQGNGVLITGINGMGIGDFISDGRGGAYNITGDIDSVYIIRIDKDGSLPWGLYGRVVDNDNAGGLAMQMNPRAANDGSGGAIIVWDKFFPWGHQLYAQRMDSSGAKSWGSNSIKLTLSDSSQEKHVVMSDGQGGVIVAWQQYMNGQYDIYAQRLDSLGVRLWGDTGVAVCAASNQQESIGMTCDNSGNSIIAWADYRISPPHIYINRYDINGNSLWQINGKIVCNTDSGQGLPGYGNVIMMATDTTTILAWHDRRNANADVYAQCYNVGGDIKWAANGVPVCDAVDLQGSAQIVPDGKGGAVLCWIDKRNTYMNIYAQRIDNNGQSVWQYQGVNICNTDSVDWYQRLATDSHGGAFICWQDKRSGNTDIYAQHVDSAGNVLWDTNGMAVCNAVRSQERPHIVQADSGTAIIAWPDYRDNYARAYAQRVGDDPNGVAGGEIHKSIFRIQNVTAYPNPFALSTNIRYQISAPTTVKMAIYNASGQLVKTLMNEVGNTGVYNIIWNGKNEEGKTVSAGVYLCRLTTGKNLSLTKKLTLTK